MESRKILHSAIISILLIFGTGGAAFAQTAPPLSGFFVSINMQPAGPFDAAGLRGLIDNGQLTRATPVWREGMVNWVPAGTVPELAPLFPATPPPLAAPPPLHQPALHTGLGEPWGGHPVIAGIANTFLGIWSFTNNDIGGGIMTAGLQLGGVALTTVAWNMFPRTWTLQTGWHRPVMGVMLGYAGNALSAVGTIYGFARGFSQYNRQIAAARSFVEAINSNPMNNISLVALPTFDDRRFVGALTYSLSF